MHGMAELAIAAIWLLAKNTRQGMFDLTLGPAIRAEIHTVLQSCSACK